MNSQTEKLLTLVAFIILLITIAVLTVTISQAWRNERFLDAELRKHTTTQTNLTK
jgi:uncharacterized membrane protein YkvI